MRRSDFGGLQRDDGARRVGLGPERLRAVNAFKVPQLLRGSAFFTDEVVVAVGRAGLRGSRISLGLGGVAADARSPVPYGAGRVGQLRGIVLTFSYGSKSKARAPHHSPFHEE